MSTELSDLEDRLRWEMRRATAGERMPRGLARRAQRNRRRRLMTRAAAAAGAAAVAAVTVAAAGTTGASWPAGIRTTAYVVEHTESALATAAADDIMDGRATDGTQEFWLYGPDSQTARLEVFSGTGQPVTDIGIVVTKHTEVETSVSYPTRTWWRGQAQEAPNSLVGPSCSVPAISPTAILSARFREDLTCGLFTDEGTQYVDGVDAIKLVSVRTVQGVASTDTVWVDPASYLPVRWAQSRGTVSVFDDDFRWLPPTSANLAQLRVLIPAGFRQVSPPQGCGVSRSPPRGAGCGAGRRGGA